MPPKSALSPNRVVAMRLREARRERGWTQPEAAERVAPFLPPRPTGLRWTKHDQAVAEASGRQSASGPDGYARAERGFTANELVAFSRAFSRPLVWFLTLPNPLPNEVSKAAAARYREVLEHVLAAGGKKATANASEVYERWQAEASPKVAEAAKALQRLANLIEPEKE